MKQLLILSGKGGTGKTTLASSFIELGAIRAYADCDVDAPNLGLLFKQKTKALERDYYGMDKAVIKKDSCIVCGICSENCAFDAIEKLDNSYFIDSYKCEGCSLCERLCPADAISMEANVAGSLKLYKSEAVFSTAELKMGQGNSGLLVTEVKEQLKDNVSQDELAVIDGSPGIGCPVIASINDVDMALIVAEASLSGLNDLRRIVETGRNFNTKMLVCINKYDLNKEISQEIENYLREENIELVGRIPYDKKIIENLNQGKTALENTRAAKTIEEIYRKVTLLLKN